jgi:CheY-like chemotaxis protein
VLFVDDEERLLETLKLGLEDEPYRCLFATSGPHALDLLKRHKVHVVVTDMHMPEMSGMYLLRTIRQQYPEVVRMVLSGHTQATTMLPAINEGHVYKYIPKPWQMEEELKPLIRSALEYYDQVNAVKAESPEAAVESA